MIMVSRIKLQDDEDGWAQVEDVKQQRACTGATTDEDEDGLEATEETWDWALEGDSSEGICRDQWVVDDFLLTGEAPPKPPPEEDVAPPVQPESPPAPPEEPPAPRETPPEEHGFRCRGCNARIFCGSDILSSNYQAMTGPGYLVDATHNTAASEERQTVMYTTGSYVICEVSCEFCDNKLGVTYVVAPDARNEYKVGKFLLGADRLILPPGVTHPKARTS